MASGIRSNNKYMQEFEKLKKNHQKRKEEITNNNNISRNRNVGGGLTNRIVSLTAPAYSQSRYSKPIGNVTGHRQVPSNNPRVGTKNSRIGGGGPYLNHPMSAKPAVGSGISGVRGLRNSRY